MQFQYTPYILPLIVSAVISSLVAAYVWPRRRTPGAPALALTAVVMTVWLLGYALEIAGTDLATKIFWGKSQYIGISLTPYFWPIFALAYTNQDKKWNTRFIPWLVILPITTLILVFTNEWHGLIWTETHLQESGNFSVLEVSYGPWFWVHFVSSYIFLLTGTIIMLRALPRMQGLYRVQSLALLLAVFAPWIGNILYFSGFNPLPGLDVTPFAFTITVVILTWAIYGYRLGGIAPIARDLVVEGMRDGMMVLDTNGRIVDMNHAASRMIGVPASQAIGQLINEVFTPWPHLIEHLQRNVEIRHEVSVGTGAAQRRYEIQVSTLYDQQKHSIGRVMTIHGLGEAFTSLPRFAVRDPLVAIPVDTGNRPESVVISNSTLRRLIGFFLVPPKTDLEVPPDVNPGWIQTLEQAFTFILRIAAVLGAIALIFTFPNVWNLSPDVSTAFLIIIGLIWLLGMARNVPFRLRTAVFLLLAYALAFVETLNFGYSVESFTFFLTFIVLAVLLGELRGGLLALFLGWSTLVFFGWQIGERGFVPYAIGEALPSPGNMQSALSSLFAFAASAAALVAAVTILLRSLNRAWQLETQALNLLQQERDLLEQRVNERTGDLAEARDEALEASRFKSQLLAKVSHELRTPLGAILGYTELLRDDAFGELSAQQKQVAGEVIDSTYYLTTLVSELLDQARFEANATQLLHKPFSPGDLLQQVKAKMSVLADRKGLGLTAVLETDLPELLYGDEYRLQQVLVNLMGNAIKFTDTGEVRVRLYRPGAGHWGIEVSDTGPGIPAEAQSYIFEPFRQVDGLATREQGGTGLGLSIVKQLTDLMGGQIVLNSEVGKGSTFTILLPLVETPEELV